MCHLALEVQKVGRKKIDLNLWEVLILITSRSKLLAAAEKVLGYPDVLSECFVVVVFKHFDNG